MKLTIKDRLFLSQRIEDSHKYVDTIIRKSIRDKLSLCVEEIDMYNIVDTEDGISWSDPDYKKDVLFLRVELDILRKIVQELDDNNEIDFYNIDVCTQIMC